MKYFLAIYVNGSELFGVKVHRSFTDLALSISRGVPFQDVAKAGLKFGDEGIF